MKSFISTKGGTLWIWNVDCVVWERWKELLIFDVLDFRVIYCEIWPAVRMIQMLHGMGFKFAAIVNYLKLIGFLEWALYQSWQPLLFTRGPKRRAIFEHISYQKFSKWKG